MTLVKSLVLGSAAALVGVIGAQAADLPLAEPVEYVRICDAFGAGFFYIPGSETCLLIGGYVRQELSVVDVTDDEDSNVTGYRTRARVWFDARTPTEYGTVRAFIRLQFQRESGGPGGLASVSSSSNDDSLFDKAFIQFGGLTAGVTDSFWDFKPFATFYNPFVSDRTPAVLAYTAEFSAGFSATVALEDQTQRRIGEDSNDNGIYGAQEFPDLVGNLRVEQDWGQAQLSGSLRQLRANPDLFGDDIDDELGFGGMFGVKVNLPFLAKGDFIWGSAAYAEGSLSLVGLDDDNFGTGNTQRLYDFNPQLDFLVVDGEIERTKAFALNLGLLHYWTPNWRSALQGSYIDVQYDVDGLPGEDWDAFTVGANLIWTPVKKLDIGAEIVYLNTSYSDSAVDSDGGRITKDDAFVGRLRIQRDF